MATIKCDCGKTFDPSNHLATGGAAAAGAAAGAWFGSSVGIVAGPLGAIAGTVPGAVIGAALAGLGVSKFAQCPSCKKVSLT